ncbi:MAG: hypothetical protein ACOWYE_05685 [Desulfatiglandales bacterium]
MISTQLLERAEFIRFDLLRNHQLAEIIKKHPNARGSVRHSPAFFSENVQRAILPETLSGAFKKAGRRGPSVFFLICVFVITCGVWRVQEGYADGEEGRRPRVFSIEFRDEPLTACVARLSVISGWHIHVSGYYEDFNVTTTLKDITLEKALARILKGVDHALKWNEETRRVDLFLYAGSETDRQGAGIRAPSPSFSVRPRHVGKPGEMSRDAEYNTSNDGVVKEPDRGDRIHRPAKGLGDGAGRGTDIPLSGSDTDFIQGTQTGRYD